MESEKSLESMLESVKHLYEKDKISESYSVLLECIEKHGIKIDSDPFLKQVETDYLESRSILSEFSDTSDWITEQEGNVKISYKKIPDTPTISLMLESVIDVPMFNFITLLYETDLYPEWVPFCKHTNTLTKVSKSRKIILSDFDVLRVAKRSACVDGYGINLLHTDGVVLIICKSVDFYKDDTRTMSKINFFGCMIQPLSENTIHLKIISNFDPNVAFLPYAILNWVVRKFANTLFKKLSNKVKQFDNSPYPERMKLEENIEFYTHLKESLDEYLNSLHQDKVD